ncbi:MAG TPA: hypothetical protein VN031_00035 [Candidatus Microsaccharimonas sp.]|nr:hypothetical protein [Candidatus Microsaccharimonas sp.]
MINPQELVSAVDFRTDFDPNVLQYNEGLGFLQVNPVETALGGLRLLGFATPLGEGPGDMDMSDVVHPLTRFADLLAAQRTIDEQGKGVGPRMHNVREAFGGAKVRPVTIGVYTFDINPSNLLDGRTTQGGKVARIGRHAGRILRSKLSGLESVVADIHDSYDQALNTGELDAVELEVPPHPRMRQTKHGVETPAGITPAFIIIRNPNILLHKVGETDAPW